VPGWLLVIIGLALVVGVVFGVLMILSFLVVRRSNRDPFVEGADHTSLANCLGTEGLELSLRGTGTLALFPNEVRFVIATPRRQVAIPRKRLGVTLEQFPNPGDYRPGDKPALVLRWSNRGQRTAVGFKVPDPEEWRDRILK
jgi:hypothetical protein